MKEGWARQQHARFLKASTIEPRLRLINRFEVFRGCTRGNGRQRTAKRSSRT